MQPSPDFTKFLRFLTNVDEKDVKSLERVRPILSQRLQDLASSTLTRNNRIQPAELIEEAYLGFRRVGLVGSRNPQLFSFMAGHLLRGILLNFATSQANAAKPDLAIPCEPIKIDFTRMALINESLKALTKWDRRRAQVVIMRYFAGMCFKDIALLLSIPERQAQREWRTAWLWMVRRMEQVTDHDAA